MSVQTSEIRIDQQPINRAINGGFDYWQRGSSFANAADFAYLADRFQNRKSAGVTSTINVNRVEDVASDSPSRYSMQIDNTSVSGALGVNDIYAIRHAVEGTMIEDLYSGSVTVQFKVKANHTATYGVSTHNSTLFGLDSQYITFDINAADTWETKTIVFDLSSGTYDFGTGVGLDVWFTLASGTNLWQGDAIDNFVDSASKSIQISDVMIYDTVHGSPKFQLVGRNKVEELSMCQRYFQNTRGGGFTVRGLTAGWDGNNLRTFETSTIHVFSHWFKVDMRVGPAMQLYNAFTGGTATAFRRFDNAIGASSTTNVKASRSQVTGTVIGAQSGNTFISNAEFDAEL